MKKRVRAAWALAGAGLVAIVGADYAAPTFAAPAAQAGAMTSFEGVWASHFDPAMMRSARPMPSLTPAYQKIYEATQARIKAGTLDIGGLCSPPGLTSSIQGLGLIEVIDGPKPSVTILFENQSQAVHIYLDGRKMPDEVDPSPNGYSVGHWEGQTLVAETKGLSKFTFFDFQGIPHSDETSLVWRISRPKPDLLEMTVVATDPLAYTKPFTFTRQFDLARGAMLIPAECENMRNPTNPDGSLGYVFKSNDDVDQDLEANKQPTKSSH